MPRPRHTRIAYRAPIRGGYDMTYDHAPSDSGWRVLAIPGTPSRPHMFSRFMRLAPEDLDVVAVNRAGYGGPLWGKGVREPVLSFEEQVEAIRPLFDRDDGKRTIVVGVSYGGALALKTALDHPGHIAGVVTAGMLVSEPRPYVLKSVKLAEWPLIRTVLPGYLHNARAELAGRRAQTGPLFDRLKDLKAPVTILHGDLDTLVPLKAADELQAWLGARDGIEFERVRGGTHYLELQLPMRVFAAVRRVIARAESAAKREPEPAEGRTA